MALDGGDELLLFELREELGDEVRYICVKFLSRLPSKVAFVG